MLEQRTGIDAACWGGNLSLAAQLRGVAGVVIDGPARDADEARGYDFTVFARSATSRTARGRIVETGTNVPIVVGDVQVSPGDYVVADGSAVVFVKAADIERVLDAAEIVADRERQMVAGLREGLPPSQVMGKNYETMLKNGNDRERQQSRSRLPSSIRPRSAMRWIDWASPGSVSTSSRSIPASA